MKYKKPKYSSYKKMNRAPGAPSKFQSIPKPLKIIGIVVAVILVVAIIMLSVMAVLYAVDKAKTEKFNAEMKEIQIAHNPDKLVYYCGTKFDPTGLIVYSLTNGGVFTKLNPDAYTITGFDSSVPVENQTLTVTYKGFTDTFTVEIREEEPAVPMLESIAMETLPKTEYKLGEGLITEGGAFVCTYSDGTTKTVNLSNRYVSGFMPAMKQGVGEYDLRVIYSENGITAETTYKITITE